MALPLIGITMGDPTGIGPEIIVKALATGEVFRVCRPIVFGDREVLEKTIERLGQSASVEVIEKIPNEGHFLPPKILLVSLSKLNIASLRFGKPDPECGEAMVRYIKEAVKWLLDGKLDAMTTCPINKEAINKAGYVFPGHTELLAHLAQSPAVAMMFLGTGWRIVLVTTHLSLKEVPRWITQDRVLATIQLADEGLRRYFGISSPRIAVLGLNPHCGEGGLLGEEETKEIVPAIEKARSRGVMAEGPFPADSFFDPSGHRTFDAVISMYHDQGLIPVKMSDSKKAVNFTLGLPFLRTSVAHGTAYDIAGLGLADPTNLVNTLLTTAQLTRSQKSAAK
jgi:4-phospho-D-threonate 3-dehydrogenase / 4-phospho-D-erythronate 3-dehydrogenase